MLEYGFQQTKSHKLRLQLTGNQKLINLLVLNDQKDEVGLFVHTRSKKAQINLKKDNIIN